MTITPILPRLTRSLIASAGTIVFGMEDGTVSIFGLIFGVAATTASSHVVLIAGASGAAAAAVSMMAGAYLDAETTRDEKEANRARVQADLALAPTSIAALLSNRLSVAGLAPGLSATLIGAVQHDPEAVRGLLLALQADPDVPPDPREQALWMLLANFLSAAVPIVPFVFLPIPHARLVSATVTITLLVALGAGRARIAGGSTIRTIAKTVSIGIAAALTGVVIGLTVDSGFTG